MIFFDPTTTSQIFFLLFPSCKLIGKKQKDKKNKKTKKNYKKQKEKSPFLESKCNEGATSL